MSFTSWLRSLRSALVPSPVDRKHRRQRPLWAVTNRPHLELLEDRCLLSFTPAVSYPAGASPSAVLTADFNGDGKLDLAVANYETNTVSVLPRNADGTFQSALTSATGSGPVSLAVGDFNGDGKRDLATGNANANPSGSYDVSVLLGNGDGTFAAPTSIAVGTGWSPTSVAVGDFNDDGKLDLGVTSNDFVIDGYGGYGHYEGRANMLLGNGDGSFALTGTQSLGTQLSGSVAVGDFNKDGNLDLVAIAGAYSPGLYSDGYRGAACVLLGNGDGTLEAANVIDVGSSPTSVAAGDVNSDGNLDLVTANGYVVSVVLGDGLGAFGSPQSIGIGSPASVVLGDFTGDGKIDVATANSYSDDLSVLHGLGDGTFTSAENSAVGSYPLGVTAGDFNGDGWLDAATANAYGTLSVLINDHLWPSELAPYLTVNDVTVTEGNTGMVDATFRLTLSGAFDQAITVHYQTAAGSATAGSDYAAASGDVTFAVGETSQTISIPVFGDRQTESTESFAVNLRSSDAFVVDGLGVGTILDDEPSVRINDVTVTEGNTGTVNATFTLTLSAASDEAITVHYQTADGSATAGSDYAGSSGDVTFAAGQTSQTITIPVLGDRLAEPTESFVVMVGDGLGVCEILDDEPSVSINDVMVTEGNTGTVNAIFTVSLSAACGASVTVRYASANQTALAGSDYQGASGAVTFAAGEMTRTITVQVNGDTLGELDETFVVNLSSVDAHVADGQGMGAIVGDEAAFVWLNPWAVDSGSFGATGAAGDVGPASATAFAYAQAWGSADPWVGPATYDGMSVSFQRTFQLVGSATGWNVTIDGLLSGTLHAQSEYYPAAGSSTSAHVEIVRAATGTVTHDLDFGSYWCTSDGGGYHTVTVSAPGSRGGLVPDGTYTVTGWLQATASGYHADFVGISSSSSASCRLDTTIDAVPWNNQPDVSISDPIFVEGNSGAVTGYFTVALSNPWDQNVTVDFALADGSATLADHDYGYVDANHTVTFVPGVMQQTIAVQIYGDRKFEPNETFSVILSSPINATIADGQGQGIILDEEPSISIKDVTVTEGNTGTRQAAFTVNLSVVYDVPVTIGYATANGAATAGGGDYQAASGTLTIPAGQTSGTITVLVNGDRLGEPNETFFVNLSNLNYGAIADGQGVGTIVDDEPRISISDVTKMEGNSGTTLFVFTVSLSAAYDAPVTVNFATSDDKAKTSDHDYQAQSGTLTFAPGETTKTITIVVYGDTKKEPKETFYLDLFGISSNSLFTKNRGIGTIQNDD